MKDALTPELIREYVGAARVLREYRVFQETGSTNTYLKEEARDGEEGLVVIAGRQTAGRGRQGRSWVAPAGSSIHCSVLLRPPLSPPDLYLLTAACALAVRDAITPLVQQPPELKWPNDVLLGGKKVCGILTETKLGSSGYPRVVLGFGINVHAAPDPETVPNATCVAAHTAAPIITRLELLASTLRHFDASLQKLYGGEADAVWLEWRGALCTLGRRVQVRGMSGGVEGRAVDVRRDGGLILETGSRGRTQVVYAGDAIEQPAG